MARGRISSKADYDVIVLGGGPAGSAAALTLAQQNVERILLVEATRYAAARIGESVPPDVGSLLDRLGVLDAFLADNHVPCLGSCASWGTDQLGYNDYMLHGRGNGWHLDRARFDRFLACKAAERGVALRIATRYRACERRPEGGFRLKLSAESGGADTVTARFVVDATGTTSSFVRNLGVRRRFLDQLLCVTGFFERANTGPALRLTMLEATEYGWWYAAALPNERMIAAVASDPHIVKQMRLREPGQWLSRLAATRHIAGVATGWSLVAGSLRARAAPSSLLDQVVGDGWLAAGDTAASFDPISSQGIRKALSDGIRAGEAIAAYFCGNDAKLSECQSETIQGFQRFARGRTHFYRLENRWPNAPFWTARRPGRAA